MKIVADENIERLVIERLRQAGFEVIAVREVARGSTDEAVLSRSVSEAALLLEVFRTHGPLFAGNFTVIDPQGIRVRRSVVTPPITVPDSTPPAH